MMIKIREITDGDFEYAIKLTDLMNWGYSERDFKWMIDFEPRGCFIAVDGIERIGITTTIIFKNRTTSIGWIGNVIISPKYRLQGIASKLVEHAIDFLYGEQVDFIGLYSYLDTSKLYKGLGFEEDEHFIKLSGTGIPVNFENCRKASDKDLKDIIELDSKIFGFNRKKVLDKICKESKNECYVMISNKEIVGFILSKKSINDIDIGPWVCEPKYFNQSLELLKAILNSANGMKINIGTKAKNLILVNNLKKMDFKIDFGVIRMFYKGKKPTMIDNFLAIESFERG